MDNAIISGKRALRYETRDYAIEERRQELQQLLAEKKINPTSIQSEMSRNIPEFLQAVKELSLKYFKNVNNA